MIIDIHIASITVTKEVGDPTFGKDESWFYFRVAKELKRHGADGVKKLAHKDGHLVDPALYYIRDRKKRWCIYDPNYSRRCISKEFDATGAVLLQLAVWEKMPCFPQ